MQPYHKQARKITKLLESNGVAVGPHAANCVAVGSVELFQGREKPVIILSAVRSQPELLEQDARHSLGFLSNVKRFNVAVTRAQVRGAWAAVQGGLQAAFMTRLKLLSHAPPSSCAPAQSLLIVVGNPAILARDPAWRALLAHAVTHGAYQGVDLTPGLLDNGSCGSNSGSATASLGAELGIAPGLLRELQQQQQQPGGQGHGEDPSSD